MAFRAVAYPKTLVEGGVDPRIAQAHAAAMEEFVASELVTRDYLDSRLSRLEARFDVKLADPRSELKADLAGPRSEFKTEMAGLQVSLIRWMIGTVGGATLAIILTLLRLVK